jgi:hypothetical protein
MKRTVSAILTVLISISMLSGCIHLKEFTQEELDRLQYQENNQEQPQYL